ncbi:MAG TPA: polyphenol oxidase family protein [Duganella sp.]|uniref:polyphenol oxidase family protein n=1 Tax=Duganella sp. TaxID=1904440 RepID=UPI002ED13DFA
MVIRSTVLASVASVEHGFGGRHDDMARHFPHYWARRPMQHERHGTHIAVAEHEHQDCGEADGMITERPGLLLAIATADCVPVLLARKDGQAVAALHVGWRGAYDGIIGRFAELLAARGDNAGDWLAATGPSAGPCCYQVSPELIAQFGERYAAMPPRVIASEAGKLNLAGIAGWQLERAGFATYSAAPECTMCHPGDGGHAYHSYRRDRETRTPIKDVQWSVIAISQ